MLFLVDFLVKLRIIAIVRVPAWCRVSFGNQVGKPRGGGKGYVQDTGGRRQLVMG